jgi:hypothetical protein
LIRNYKIRDAATLHRLNTLTDLVPLPLLHIVAAQKNIPAGLLNIGLLSKAFMLFNYITFFIGKRGSFVRRKGK